VFASQYWGRRDVAGVRRALGLSLVFAVGGSAVFALGAIVTPAALLSVFTNDRAVIAEGVAYLRIVGLSYVVTAVSMAFTHALRSVGDTTLPMYAAGVSIALNIVGNYLLIFGALGLPAMGVAGAAIATAIARALELLIILGFVYRRRGPVAARLRDLIDWDRDFVGRFIRRASPVVFNELLWSTGFTMYTVVFGRMGTSHLAAYTIADTIGKLLLVMFISTGQASAVLIGNEIGAGNVRRARQIGRTIMYAVPVASTVVGLVGFVLVAPGVPQFFDVSAEVRTLVRQFLRLFSILIVVKTVNMHIIVGILRGGGDTRFALVIDILPLWLIGVPAAFVTGLVLGLPAPIVYLALNAEELTRLWFGWRRVRRGDWIYDLTSALRSPQTDVSAPPADAVTGGRFPAE
jgi:putative MATE family efflux protein